MKENEVPQDDGGLFEGKFKALKYAIDENGDYVEVQSVGWEPETVVLNQAWDVVHEQTGEAKKKFLSGEWSPLAYHTFKAMMDETLLAEFMGLSKSKIKEHLYSPEAFKNLSYPLLEKYSEVLNVPIDLLKTVE